MSNWYAWLNMLVGLIVIVNPLLCVSSITPLASDKPSQHRRPTARAYRVAQGVIERVHEQRGLVHPSTPENVGTGRNASTQAKK